MLMQLGNTLIQDKVLVGLSAGSSASHTRP